MFAHFKGVIEDLGVDRLVIDVQGVGYDVMASRLTLSNLQEGSVVKLFIETIMRQEALHLFGFLTKEELHWFRLLTSVQGVGPKVALNIVGNLGLHDLYQAISLQDKVALNRAEGVGPKLAARILLELKEKVQKASFNAMKEGDHRDSAPGSFILTQEGSSAMMDAISALMNLGYTRSEVMRVFADLGEDTSTKDTAALIQMALKAMRL